MRSILVYANQDDGLESRLQASLDLGRAFDAHLTCLQVTPYNSYVFTDPFGGSYAIPELLEAISQKKEENRLAVEQKMGGEGAHWSWLEADGASGQSLVRAGHLSDLIVVSLPGESSGERPEWMGALGEVVVHGRSPILAVPAQAASFDCFGPAVVAWNGSPESCHAMRAALPLLKQASTVHIVSVKESSADWPATQACDYLGWHGVKPVLHEVTLGSCTVADVLANQAEAFGAAYMVMGAYGHSRFREAVLGGTTRDLLKQEKLPLLLGR
jgi:nucleotide-binding universal stress UspA family protein